MSINNPSGSKPIDIEIATRSLNPKVSIMIISYNQEKYIREAIQGAIEQDYPNIEIIVSDDGSKDKTPEIILDYANRFPEKIKPILNKKNSGITANCNVALRACSGEFIVFFGGDDIMLPGKITAQVEWFQSDKSRVLCATLSEDIFADGAKCPNQPKYDADAKGVGPLNFIRRRKSISGTTLMIRAAAIPVHGFEESITVASDQMFCIEVLMRGGTYGCVNQVYTKRRIHSDNISRNQQKIISDQEATYKLLASRYPCYARECDRAIAEHVFYYSGVSKLKLGDKVNARRSFLRAIKARPLYWKAFVRLLQSYFPYNNNKNNNFGNNF